MQDTIEITRKILIQDIAVISRCQSGLNPVGEANDATPVEPPDDDMMVRLFDMISQLMEYADTVYLTNSNTPESIFDIDPDYITRIITHEFFFYTKEPLALLQFQDLLEQITTKAKKISSGVELILSSFAVKNASETKIANATVYCSCGETPVFNIIIKNHTSNIDFHYTHPRGTKWDILDIDNPDIIMPEITVNSSICTFSFDNIIHCKTPGNTPFLTAVDICYDHYCGVAINNYHKLITNNSSIAQLDIYHVVVSNSMKLFPNECIVKNAAVMHVDPYHSLKSSGCKQGTPIQQPTHFEQGPFGNQFKMITLPKHFITNPYHYDPSNPKVVDPLEKKVFITPDLNNDDPEFVQFCDKYIAFKGAHLKYLILEDLKHKITKITSMHELVTFREHMKTTHEYRILKTGEGLQRTYFGLFSRSVQNLALTALEDMLNQQEQYLSRNLPSKSFVI